MKALYEFYVRLQFTYLEINPIGEISGNQSNLSPIKIDFYRLCFFVLSVVLRNSEVHVLDLAAKLDQCAEFLCKALWGEIDFPPPFGREAYPEVNLAKPSRSSLKILDFTLTSGSVYC